MSSIQVDWMTLLSIYCPAPFVRIKILSVMNFHCIKRMPFAFPEKLKQNTRVIIAKYNAVRKFNVNITVKYKLKLACDYWRSFFPERAILIRNLFNRLYHHCVNHAYFNYSVFLTGVFRVFSFHSCRDQSSVAPIIHNNSKITNFYSAILEALPSLVTIAMALCNALRIHILLLLILPTQ